MKSFFNHEWQERNEINQHQETHIDLLHNERDQLCRRLVAKNVEMMIDRWYCHCAYALCSLNCTVDDCVFGASELNWHIHKHRRFSGTNRDRMCYCVVGNK